MGFAFFSLIDPTPPGFTFQSALSGQNIPSCPFALLSPSRTAGENWLTPFTADCTGLIVTRGPRPGWEELGPRLYHLVVSDQDSFPLTELLRPHLELLARLEKAAEDRLRTARKPLGDEKERRRDIESSALVKGEQFTETSERSQMENELYATSETLRQVMDTIPHYVFWKSPDLTYLGCNDRFAKSAGLTTAAEIIGKDDYQLAWSATAENYRADDRKVIEHGRTMLNFIEPQARPDGSTLWLETSKVPLRDGAGDIWGILGIYQDVTARKEAEERLEKSERQLRAIFETSQAGIILVDHEGIITFANRRMAEMFGCPLEEVIGSSYLDHLHPEEGRIGEKLMHRLINGEIDRVSTERRYLRANGSYSWGYLSGTRLEKPDGQFQGLVGIISDVSDRRQAEEARAKALEFSEILLDQSPMGIRVFDGETGHCIKINQAAANISGGPVELLMQQNFRELNSWREGGMTSVAEAVLADGISRQVESDMTTSFGRTLSVRYFYARFFVEKRPHLMTIGQDISEEKRLVEEKQRMEEQLLHVQKLESLGVLAGGIAHDFNNILMTVIGNAELALIRLSPESPAVNHLQQILIAASKAADLAGQMLAYSGKGKFVVESLNLNRIIEEMLHMLEVSISKHTQIRFLFNQHLPAVEADATQLRQVIMNLVINASESIGEQNGMISITTGAMDCDRAYLRESWLDDGLSEGQYVYLEITDTGCGMNKETIDRLFEPFFSTKFTGRGLGMAAVLGIVRGHKGAIKIYSEVGKGTTFKVLLPVISGQVALVNDLPPDSSWHGCGQVLLVDDESTVRSVGKLMLEELGFEVLTAANGREALLLFKKHRNTLALVLLDLTMPHMGGEEAFAKMRQLDPAVKVVITSGYNEQEITHLFVGKGLSGFIQKPFRLSALRGVLSAVVKNP